jgi:isoquinoline 1-oxidoreductase beta subunit
MRPGTAQGIGVHHEYKSFASCVAEIDCTPVTVNRPVTDGYTGPRVTKVVFAVDVGLPINPLGLQAQMMGGVIDGVAQALRTASTSRMVTSSRAAGTTRTTRANGTHRSTCR